MTVGLNMEASPFVPFLILLDVSIIVNGVEYPIRTPHNIQTSSVMVKKRYIIIYIISCLNYALYKKQWN